MLMLKLMLMLLLLMMMMFADDALYLDPVPPFFIKNNKNAQGKAKGKGKKGKDKGKGAGKKGTTDRGFELISFGPRGIGVDLCGIFYPMYSEMVAFLKCMSLLIFNSLDLSLHETL